MSIKRRTSVSDPYNQMVGNSITQNFNESMKRKARQKRTPSVPKSLMEMFFGQRGAGKSYSSLLLAAQSKAKAEDDLLKKIEEDEAHDEKYKPKVAEITDDELKELHEPARQFFAMADIFAYGGGGGGASNGGAGGFGMMPLSEQKVPEQIKQNEGYTNYWQPPPYTPWNQQQQQYPQPHIWTDTNTGSPFEAYRAKTRKKKKQDVAEESKKEEFNPEDHKGRFCAVVTILIDSAGVSVEHNGVLFVKKCGHWKLLDFNGNKLAGGTAGSFEGDVKKGRLKIDVHRVLFDADAPVIEETDLEII
jgi:hypothetical protein